MGNRSLSENGTTYYVGGSYNKPFHNLVLDEPVILSQPGGTTITATVSGIELMGRGSTSRFITLSETHRDGDVAADEGAQPTVYFPTTGARGEQWTPVAFLGGRVGQRKIQLN